MNLNNTLSYAKILKYRIHSINGRSHVRHKLYLAAHIHPPGSYRHKITLVLIISNDACTTITQGCFGNSIDLVFMLVLSSRRSKGQDQVHTTAFLRLSELGWRMNSLINTFSNKTLICSCVIYLYRYKIHQHV